VRAQASASGGHVRPARSPWAALLVTVLAALAVALVGCKGTGPGRLRGSPPIPPRDTFRYVPLRARVQHPTGPVAPIPIYIGKERPKAAVLMPPADAAWMPPVRERRWQWIVIHHSATDHGSAAVFDDWHRNGRNWDELGYHFVIGNGTDTADGLIEVGSRWQKQKHGAHCKVWNRPEYNQVGIGVCLVGDFEKTRPSEAQMQALARLVDWLSARYRIPEKRIIGHGHVCDTRCPGRNFLFDDFLNRLRARRTARARAAKAR